jgi:leader peptidase (prepilin peptidase)/N-methyltransferase
MGLPVRCRAVGVSAGVAGAVLGAGLGLLAGPFLAGLTVRLPAGEPLVTRAGWGGAPAGRTRLLVVTALAGAVLGVVGAGVGWHAQLPAYLWLAAVGVTLAVVDAETKRLPDRLTLPSYPVGIVLLGAASLVAGDWAALGRGVLGGAVVFVVFFILAFISPRSLGLGDVKLAGLLGLYLGWLGWGVLLLGLIAGFAVGGLVAVTLLAGRRVGWRGDVAFGPSLLAGAVLAMAVGQRLVDAYLTASGLPPA